MRVLIPLLFLAGAACGYEPPAYSVYGVDFFFEEGVPHVPRGDAKLALLEIDRFWRATEGVSAINTLRYHNSVRVHFTADLIECYGVSSTNVCAGLTELGGETFVYQSTPCLAASSFVHEIIHSLGHYTERDADGDHSRATWWDYADYDSGLTLYPILSGCQQLAKPRPPAP